MNFANLKPISKLVIKNNRHETNLGNFNLWVIRWGYHYTFPLSFFYPSNQTKQRKVLFSGQFPWGGFLNSLFGYWMVFFHVCFRSLWFTTEHVPLLKVHKLTGLEGPVELTVRTIWHKPMVSVKDLRPSFHRTTKKLSSVGSAMCTN